jgi:hypothetical protein
MDWGFLWIMVVLKLPVIALLLLVWWAVRQVDEEPGAEDGGDGGSKLPRHPRPTTRGPRSPRRGPHGDPPVPAPARVRTAAVARERDPQRQRA